MVTQPPPQLLAVLRASVLALAFLLAGSGVAAAEVPRVYVGVYLHDVTSFDQKDGVFDVDADLWAKWRGDFDPAKIRIANGARLEQHDLGRDDDGTWHSARWRIRGTLRGEFPVHRFPFDEQTLAVVLELPKQDGHLVPDLAGSGMASRFSITDWLYRPEFRPAVAEKVFPSDLGDIDVEGRAATLRRVGFEVTISRPIRPVVLKLFLPLAIVAMVVLASLFVHPDSTQPRVTMSVTGLVACFAFQFSVSDVLPEVAYLTLADTVFIVVYVISTGCVTAAVTTHYLHRKGLTDRALLLDRVLRPALPLTALLMIWVAMPPALPARVVEPDPIPVMKREASSRDTVRIGTTGRLRVASSPPGRAAYWPVLYDDAQQGRQVVLVERAPSVDNDAMRFLAGGEVEVTWRLREGAKWSDGTPVTTKDLVLPLEASPDQHIAERRTPDGRTLVLRWKDRLSRALEPPDLWPSHVVEQKFRAEGYEAVRQHLGEVGVPSVGPYLIASHDDKLLVGAANPHFVGAPPSIANVHVIHYPNSKALVQAFLAGEVDITEPNDVDVEDVATVATRQPEAVHQRPSSTLVLLQPNLDHPLLRNHEVRRAILQAIDRERITREIYGQGSQVAHVPNAGDVPPGAVHYAHDPDAARRTLEAAGAVGALLPLVHSAGVPAALIQQIVVDLGAVGLEVQPEEVRSSWGPWRERSQKALLLHEIRATRESSPQQWWYLPSVDGRFPEDARNAAYDDAIAKLIHREQRALYPERREQLRDALDVAWSERLPGLPLVFTDERILVSPALRGWERPAEVPFGRGLEKWYFAITPPDER